jgi:hypothetical protein
VAFPYPDDGCGCGYIPESREKKKANWFTKQSITSSFCPGTAWKVDKLNWPRDRTCVMRIWYRNIPWHRFGHTIGPWGWLYEIASGTTPCHSHQHHQPAFELDRWPGMATDVCFRSPWWPDGCFSIIATWCNQADFHQLLSQLLSVTMAYNGHINSRQAGANTRVICVYGSKLDRHPSSKTWDPWMRQKHSITT